MTLYSFLARINDILHKDSGINGHADQKAMICEAYDIHISALEEQHAQSRTQALLDYFTDQVTHEEAQYAKAKFEQEHDL